MDTLWLGRRDYQEVWDLQKELASKRFAGEIPDTLLLLEHPPTLTFGRVAEPAHLLASPETLEREGVTVIESDRGGDITYHGPGQLVGYPIFNLQEPPHTPDLHLYLRHIEEALILALSKFGIVADRFPGYTGVWVGRDTPHPQKIAAIGVKASRWVTMHGFALNVNPDLSHFDMIVPCGIQDYGVTSLSQQLQHKLVVTQILPPIIDAFCKVFHLANEPIKDMSGQG